MTSFIAPTANPVFFRTYSRRFNEQRESWDEVCDRTVKALIKLGCLTRGEAELVMRMQESLKTFPSGRWLWVGGTKWSEDPNNFYGMYNCYSGRTVDWKAFAIAMDLAMQGTGTGAMLEDKFIRQLPIITTHLDVKVVGTIGSVEPHKRREDTEVRIQREYEEVCVFITVGDSRKGWGDSYHKLLELSSSDYGVKPLRVLVDVSNVRPSGEPLKGFGGTSNPSMLEGLYTKVANVLNKANGRKLTAVECCLIIDEAALVIVSGNIRRCLAYGSMVSTDKGRKAIQDIEVGDMVLTTKGYWPVTDKFEQGVQSVCRIITSGSQNSLRCTERHQVAVLNGGTYKMVPAGNLQRGDLLVRVSPSGAVAPDRILSVEWNVDKVETFDIEVDGVHEFVCEGLLVHNSAGMKQGSSTDVEFAQAKLNLWQQDDAGNWRIDPERDALRMSNHTRVYHTKPSLEECIDAVRQQYYSGEGAIQWAGEAVARANADLFPKRSQQVKFIKAYEEGRGEAYLRKVSPGIHERELKHRMERFGLNPCLTADTWIHTEQGPRQIKDLIGKQQNLYVNGKLFPTTPEGFFYSGDKQVFKLETVEGYSIRLTDNHKLYKFDDGLCWWTEVKDLKPGDKVKVHNHYGATWGKWDKEKHHKDPNDSKDLEKSSFEFYLNYLRRRFHHLGDVVNGTVALTLSDPSDTISIQRMLLRLGITSKIDKSSLTISSGSLNAFTKLIGFSKLGPASDRQTRLEEAVRYADYLDSFTVTVKSITPDGIEPVYDCQVPGVNCFDANGFMSHNCGEIVMADGLCNLSEIHLNNIDPFDFKAQADAFKAGGIMVAALLHHKFPEERLAYSRQLDPIVGVSFTGLFDFFVNAFGVDWLRWWEAGRPEEWRFGASQIDLVIELGSKLGIDDNDDIWNNDNYEGRLYKQLEQAYLSSWKKIVQDTVWDYCDRHGLKRPNRYTTTQPAGTKSLLTGASPGWSPAKAQRFIRRITFGKNDPVALACIDYGYSVIPSQSDKDENGNLLNDPFDERCTEWLVEIPVAVNWADLPGADSIDISKFGVLAQVDFAMQVQQHYVGHNCFSRDTEFLTSEGIKTFEDYRVGDVVNVLNGDGDWTPATVVNTGDPRPMLKITLRQGSTGKEKVIKSTYCHRFPVRRASGKNSKIKIVTADKLKVGQRFVINSADAVDMDIEGIRHGMVFGDGSAYKNSKGEYWKSQLYLCGDKRELEPYFSDYERIYRRDDIDQTRIYDLPLEWKYLPSKDKSQSYVAGFIAGLLATDGNITGSVISMSTIRQDVVDYITTQAPRVGILVTGTYKATNTTGYNPGTKLFQIKFSKKSYPANMILRTFHQDKYYAKGSQPRQWRIVNIDIVDPEIGWCVMEPITNHFTLTENLLVMNTSATWEMREDEIEPLGKRIYDAIQNDEGYISAALLARFDDKQTYPRLPFEPIDKAKYDRLSAEVLERRVTDDFQAALARYDKGDGDQAGPAGCDSDKCLLPEKKPE